MRLVGTMCLKPACNKGFQPVSSSQSSLLHAVESAIRDATGTTFRVHASQARSGGSIHHASLVQGRGGERYFVKANSLAHAANFAAEASGLAAIARTRTVRVPRVITRGATDTHAFLVLEYLELQALDARSGARLGEALAALHAHSAPRFGFDADNFIGASPQSNTWSDDWPSFFAARRLRPQLDIAHRNALGASLIDAVQRVIERCPTLLAAHSPSASLVHGDLWGGNAAAVDGEPVIFDPAAYYGDGETDLAMTELFGGFPHSFYTTYRAARPVDAGYATRKTLYNLYHVLNHANLFGGSYIAQARQMAHALVAST